MSNLDLQDLYYIHAMGDRNNVRSRAKTIQDNLGVRTEELEDYRNRNGGFGLLKAVGIALAAIAVGAVIAVAAPAEATIAITAITASVAGFAGFISMASQNEKVMKGYSAYLDDAAAQGRALREGKAPAQNMEKISAQDMALVNQRIAAMEEKLHADKAAAPSQQATGAQL